MKPYSFLNMMAVSSHENAMTRLQEQLCYRFRNPALLREALTHVTWSMEHQQKTGEAAPHQQRLEFLGDAFLTYEIARRLYAEHPDASEGELTRKRQQLVEGNWLDNVARSFDALPECLRLGVGERLNQSTNQRWRKDTLEAVLGAILQDGGEGAARAFIDRFIVLPDMEPLPPVDQRDPTIAFGEYWQKNYRTSMPEPVYYSYGPDNLPTWNCEVQTPDGMCFVGENQNKKQARREACRQALFSLGIW